MSKREKLEVHKLPFDCLREVLSFLKFGHLVTLRLVCKEYNKIIIEKSFLKRVSRGVLCDVCLNIDNCSSSCNSLFKCCHVFKDCEEECINDYIKYVMKERLDIVLMDMEKKTPQHSYYVKQSDEYFILKNMHKEVIMKRKINTELEEEIKKHLIEKENLNDDFVTGYSEDILCDDHRFHYKNESKNEEIKEKIESFEYRICDGIICKCCCNRCSICNEHFCSKHLEKIEFKNEKLCAILKINFCLECKERLKDNKLDLTLLDGKFIIEYSKHDFLFYS